MDKLRKEEQRRKYKEDMIYSMKFETEEDVFNYEQSVYNIMDKDNPDCLYDLVEGYSDDYEYIGITEILNDVIDQLGQGYNTKEFVSVLSQAILKMKGKTDENAEILVYMLVMRDNYYYEYTRVLDDIGEDVGGYHAEIINNLREDGKKYGEDTDFEIRATKVLEIIGIKYWETTRNT